MRPRVRARSTRQKLSVEDALARVPAGEWLTIEQFMFAVGITSPLPIRKWVFQTRVKQLRLFSRRDVVKFIENRFKAVPEKPAQARRRTSRKGDRRWYESQFTRKGIDLLCFTGATADLDSDRRRLHELLDGLLDELGAESFSDLVCHQAAKFGANLLTRP